MRLEAGIPVRKRLWVQACMKGGWSRAGEKEFIGDTLGSLSEQILIACCMWKRER